MNGKVKVALKPYGRAFQSTPLSAAADARIRAALESQTPSARRWLPLVGVFAMASIILGVVTLREPSRLTPLACDVTRDVTTTRYSGSCDIELTAMTVRLERDAVLEQLTDQVRLSAGTAHFRVRKVNSGEPPVAVLVPEASILVLGTEFTVTVVDTTSHIHLRSGHVRFVHQGRGAIELAPGQRLTFEANTGNTELVTVNTSTAALSSDAPIANPPTSSELPSVSTTASTHDVSRSDLPQPVHPRAAVGTNAGSATRPDNLPPAGASSGLETALQLRSQGRYEEALTVLDRVEPQGARAREVVDFEQAALTELKDPKQACARYRSHLERFPSSRYRGAVHHKLTRCTAISKP